MPPARDLALPIPEVLEIILLHLPLNDLLINAQLVKRLFHDLIASSPRLQQAVFFCPNPNVSLGKVHRNPLLRQKFPPWFEDNWLKPCTYKSSDHKHFLRLDWNGSRQRAEAYARKEASWRRMLVAQPPIRDLIVKIRTKAIGGPRHSRGELKFEDGLRMGLFYDLVQDFVEHQPVMYFSIRWYIPSLFEGTNVEMAESENSNFITVHLRLVIQSQPGMTGKIGPEFKSLAYTPIEIDYCPLISEPLPFGPYFI